MKFRVFLVALILLAGCDSLLGPYEKTITIEEISHPALIGAQDSLIVRIAGMLGACDENVRPSAKRTVDTLKIAVLGQSRLGGCTSEAIFYTYRIAAGPPYRDKLVLQIRKSAAETYLADVQVVR